MASFTESSISVVSLLPRIEKVVGRGGAAICFAEPDSIYIHGGADRQPEHFQDLYRFRFVENGGKWRLTAEEVTTTGDAPTPRSGHSMVSYGRFLLLFGGIDFAEEVAYNDFYAFDTASGTWFYIGETGAEISGRNAHSLAVLQRDDKHVLVLFGGASPEQGPLGDTYFAELPPPGSIEDPAQLVVHWQPLPPGPAPSAREMHSTASADSWLLISGGRDLEGNLLTDTWSLQLQIPTEVQITGSSSANVTVRWQEERALALPRPSCAHCAALLRSADSSTEHETWRYVTAGGLSHEGLAGYVDSVSISVVAGESASLTLQPDRSGYRSQTADLAKRFGHALTVVDQSFTRHIRSTSRRASEAESEGEGDRKRVAAVIFGGVDADNDYSDLVLLS